MPLTLETEERMKRILLNNITIVDECWIWTGKTVLSAYKNAYGYFYYKCKHKNARRMSYLVFRCTPPAKDKAIDVICGEPLCINPEHLVVSHRRKSDGAGKSRDRSPA